MASAVRNESTLSNVVQFEVLFWEQSRSVERTDIDKPLVYLGGRFLVGFGNSLAQLSCPVLLTEICHPQHRGIVTAIYNCLWNLGACGKCSSIGLP